jgi:hypothetical protein
MDHPCKTQPMRLFLPCILVFACAGGPTKWDRPTTSETDTAEACVPGPLFDHCDGVDNDCDGSVDEDERTILYADEDGDGVGAGEAVSRCPAPGWVEIGGDCAPNDSRDHPRRVEGDGSCWDGRDNDCDGSADCYDVDCQPTDACVEDCRRRGDEDRDGFEGCADLECKHLAECQEDCIHWGGDEDMDGLIDCEDPDCAERCIEQCDRPGDEDNDGLEDCDDDDCFGLPECIQAVRITGGVAYIQHAQLHRTLFEVSYPITYHTYRHEEPTPHVGVTFAGGEVYWTAHRLEGYATGEVRLEVPGSESVECRFEGRAWEQDWLVQSMRFYWGPTIYSDYGTPGPANDSRIPVVFAPANLSSDCPVPTIDSSTTLLRPLGTSFHNFGRSLYHNRLIFNKEVRFFETYGPTPINAPSSWYSGTAPWGTIRGYWLTRGDWFRPSEVR